MICLEPQWITWLGPGKNTTLVSILVTACSVLSMIGYIYFCQRLFPSVLHTEIVSTQHISGLAFLIIFLEKLINSFSSFCYRRTWSSYYVWTFRQAVVQCEIAILSMGKKRKNKVCTSLSCRFISEGWRRLPYLSRAWMERWSKCLGAWRLLGWQPTR